MADIRRTSEYRKLLPFIAVASSDVWSDTIGEDVSALLLALETHKTGSDHDGRYYTETEVDSALILKADKTVTLVAGNGLSGGGDLSANRTFDVLAGLGIDFDVNGAVIVDLTENYNWTGEHTFTKYLSTASIYPNVSDTYDLGDYNRLWRKIWGSELSAIVFAQYTQVLLGGWFTVSKGEGIIQEAVNNTQTTINLGTNNFATNDIIVFRGLGAGNNPQIEYMKVGTLVSGTTYNVIRDLDGTGANAWPEGSVYGNWGQTGNGRVELNAYDTPRMSVYSQGMSYNDATEEIRIGDLYGQWGYNTNTYGAAFGSYKSGKANITIDPTNGIRIRNYNQTVIQLNGTEASFENVIKLGTYARLEQGTGTWGTDFTGSAIWSEGSPAIMMMGGLNNNIKQWWGGSDGKLYAGGGDVILDEDGITINTPQYSADPSNTIKFNYHNQEFYSIVGYNAGNQVTHLFESNSGNPMIKYDWIINDGQSSITYDQYLWRQDVFDNQWTARNKFQLGGISDTSFAYYINGLKSSDWNYKVGMSGDINSQNGISELLLETTNYNATYTDKQARILIQADVKTPSSKINLTADSINVIGNADISGNLVVDGTIKDGDGVAYLKSNAKAADSDKLDGLDSTAFATAGHDHDSDYLGISAKAADSDKLANTTPSSFALSILDDTNAAAVKTTLGLKITIHPGIADDDVHSFTPDISQGFMLYRKLGGATNALISYDAITGTAYCTKIAGSADVEVRTGALTGTTGTDGKLTISAHTDGKIYINNRLGTTIYGGYLTL